MNYIILLALAAQVLLLMAMQSRLFVGAEKSTAISTTRTSTTTTTVLSTYWVVLTDLSCSPVTYTTTGSAPGSTIGISTVLQSTKVHSHNLQPSSQPSLPAPTNMSWQGQSLRDAVLNSTNYFRTAHEANPLKWNNDLATYARNYADHCEFSHSVRPPPSNSSTEQHSNNSCRAAPMART